MWDQITDNLEDDYNKKMKTLNSKARYCPRVIIYNGNDEKLNINVIEISKEFLKDATRSLKRDINDNDKS